MQVLLVEDDTQIARELTLRWQARGWAVRRCGTMADAQRDRAAGIDLVVLDLNLPDGDGTAWLQQLRQHDSNTPVMVLTARDRVDDRVLGLRSGADDYLVKPFSAAELDARLDALIRRSHCGRGEEVRFGRLAWRARECKAYLDNLPMQLSPREFEVLGQLIKRAPHLLRKSELGELLAERNLDVAESAAEVYVSRLRRKLVGSGLQIRTFRGFGYALLPAGEPLASQET